MSENQVGPPPHSGRVMEELDDSTCRDLLAAHHFGRIGVVVDGYPSILPVNYAFDGRRVAIRSDPGSKLTAADLSKVAFEVDAIEEDTGRGWSVLVQGFGWEITDAVDHLSTDLRDLRVQPWAPGEKRRWIRIDPRRITGRRLR